MRSDLGWFAAGLALVAAWELPLGGLRLAGLSLHPGMAAYLAICALALPVAWAGRGSGAAGSSAGRSSPLWRAWVFASAVATADLPAMTVRPEELAGRLLTVAGGAVLAGLLILPLLALGGRARGGLGRRRRDADGVAAWALAMIALFQLFNRWLRWRGVPNEERSLMVGGVEIHHLGWGVLLLVAVVLVSAALPDARRRRTALLAALGVGVGLILDQSGFLMVAELSDDTYFHPGTPVSGLVALAACWLFWRIASQERGRVQDPSIG